VHPLHAQVVVAVLLESFYAARQQFKEKEARVSAAEARSVAAKDAELALLAEEEASAKAMPQIVGDPKMSDGDGTSEQRGVVVAADVALMRAAAATVAELQLEPLLEKLVAGFDTARSLSHRIDMLFDRSNARSPRSGRPMPY
jgi:hypothetical protein